MKPNQFQTTGIVLLVLFSTCRSAPVLNKSPENTDSRLPALGNVKQVSEQERELESLAHGSNILGSDVKVEEHHHVTYENVNGKEQEVQETEKAVINNGQVVSDVKQEVTKTETEEGEPETHVETEIDIPSKGIHEKFSEDDDNELVEEDEMQNPGINVEDVEESVVTPEALAEYLWDTQDFAKFRTSLESIVDSKIMTPEEAQGFYQDVVMEYDKLRQLNALYPFQSEDEETFLSPLAGRPQYSNVIPGLPAEEMTLPIESYAQKRIPQQLSLYGDDYQGLSDYELEQQREAYELNAAIQRQAAVDDMLKALLEEWFASAIESGDTDAAKTVSDLANYLSQRPASQYDDDRVREVLAEVFAAMANGEQEPEEESEETSSSEEIVPSEAQPLPNTEGIEQQLKNIPSKSEESKPTDNEETESSGEEDSPVGKENEIPQKSA